MAAQAAVALENQQLGDHVVQKGPVVTHHQQGALIFQELLFEQLQGLQIEIVGGLVEHQQVGRPGQQTRQQQAVALAAGEGRHRLARPLGTEQKILEIAHHMAGAAAHGDAIAAQGEVVEHGGVFVEGGAQLVEMGHLEAGAEADPPLIRLQLPEQQTDQGGLATAVGADDAEPVTAQDGEIEIPYQGAAAPAMGHPLGLADQPPGALAGVDAKARPALAGPPLAHFGAQGLEPPHAPFVAGAARLDALADPVLFLIQQLVLPGLLGGFGGLALFAAAQIVGIIARPVGEPAAVEFQNPGGEPLEKGAVVGHEEQAAAPVEEKFLEPGDGFQVEMIGGLVEQQKIGPAGQRPGQEHPPLEPPGESVEVRLGIQAQARDHFRNTPLHFPGAGGFHGRLDRFEFAQGGRLGILRQGRAQRMVALEQRGGGFQAVGHHVEDAAAAGLGHRLIQPGHFQARSAAHLAFVGRQLAGDDLEQGGLALPVAAEQTDPLPRLDGEIHRLHQRRRAKGEAEVAKGDQRHEVGKMPRGWG